MKKLWMVLALMLVGSLSCTTKPVYYELPEAPGFRLHDKTVKSTLVDLDSFLIEDSESANVTKYTTAANIKTYIGAEPALVNEAGLYNALVDVTQFYESGDNITTAGSATLPTTCSFGQLYVDSDYDTTGLLCVCISTNVWKCGQSVPSADKILEGDSSVEVIDTGTGRVEVDIDGNLRGKFDADGLDVNGTIECDGVSVGAVASPRVRALSTGCLGADKYAGSIDWVVVNGADGAEDVDILLKSQEGGANTTQAHYDESDMAWEIPDGKNLILAGGYIVGKAKRGTAISANTTLTTTQLHGTIYNVTAACKVTLDAAADVGFDWIVGFRIKDAAETLIIEIDGADKINLHGTVLDAGDTIDSPGNAGDFIFLMSTTDADGSGTNGYETWGYAETEWSDGGVS